MKFGLITSTSPLYINIYKRTSLGPQRHSKIYDGIFDGECGLFSYNFEVVGFWVCLFSVIINRR